MYALKLKSRSRVVLSCVSATPEEFQDKVRHAFWLWKGTQAQGNQATLENYLSDYDQVVFQMEPYAPDALPVRTAAAR